MSLGGSDSSASEEPARSQAKTLTEVLSRASETVTPPLLQRADTFVELAGEEFRKRLFLTEGHDGREYCLRPDFTIPVCLEHLKNGRSTPIAYAYEGKIFRKRRAIGEPEFSQAGTEWLGHPSEIATDADLFALAMECAAAVRLDPRIRVGDAHLFAALTEALDLSSGWLRRLQAAFGDGERLAGTLDRLGRRERPDGIAARLTPALARMDTAQARATVDAVVSRPQWAPAEGRTSEDIAERILAQAAFTAADRSALPVITEYLSLAAPLARASDLVETFARTHGLDFGDASSDFAARTEAFRAHGIDTEALHFEASFGRRLDYYTGFVFDMVDPAEPRAEVIAGGRYDKLIALLDPSASLPAIGFSVWLDRLPPP